MEDVTQRFLDSLGTSHKVASVLTVTTPGGDAETVEIKSGTVSVDSGRRIRRTATLGLLGDTTAFKKLVLPGSLFRIDHGIVYGGTDRELVPVFTGELTSSEQNFGDGSIPVTLADHGNWLSRTKFLTPQTVTGGRAAAISAMVTTAKPGTLVANDSTDAGTVGSRVWTDGPLDVIADLSKDGGTEAFFRPDGVFQIRDARTLDSVPVWRIAAGQSGVLKSAKRRRPLDRLYNTVVVRPSATDGSQTWTQQVAQVTDVTHERHPSKIGVVPYFWASPTILDAGTALGVASRILDRVLGTTETLQLGAIANPALEANDVVRVVTPSMNTEAAQIFQHFIDSFTLDLRDGDMAVATRSQVVTE